MRGWTFVAVALCGTAIGFNWGKAEKFDEPPKEKPGGNAGQPKQSKYNLPVELEELNDLARQKYRTGIDAEIAGSGPIVIYTGDELVLRKGKERTAVPIIPTEYAVVKCTSHVALGTHSILAPHANGNPLPDAVLASVKEFRGVVVKCEPALEGRGLDADTLARQKRLIASATAFLDKVLADGKVTEAALLAYCRGTRADLLANATTAARAQLSAMHKQMMAWKKELTAEEWARLKAIVQGSQLPRTEHLAVQYFARLFGETGEGRRIVYAESLWEEDRAIALLARKAAEGRLGEAFFGDYTRFHRDFLGSAARTVLDDIFAAP